MHRLESEGGGQTNPNNLDKQYKIKATSQNYENPNPSEGGISFLSIQFFTCSKNKWGSTPF